MSPPLIRRRREPCDIEKVADAIRKSASAYMKAQASVKISQAILDKMLDDLIAEMKDTPNTPNGVSHGFIQLRNAKFK